MKRLITALIIALLCLPMAIAQRMYDGSGRQIGRVDGDRYYDGSGLSDVSVCETNRGT